MIDRGREWTDLAGVRVEGVAEAFPAEHPDLRAPMSSWHEKYRQMFARDGFEAFTRDVPVARVPARRALARGCVGSPVTASTGALPVVEPAG